MGSKIVTHDATTFTEVVDIIETFQTAHETVWYRGCGDLSFKLDPSLYRHPSIKSAEDFVKLEKQIGTIFSQKSPPFVNQPFTDAWERMFFMQHYGVPTRLLDWTESPFIALYFALMSCPRDKKKIPTRDATIWLLDPVKWNQSALEDIGFSGGIIHPDDPQIKGYHPDTELDERRTSPIMIYGTYNSPRIVAQRGIFALFGKITSPMESQFSKSIYSPGTLERIKIPKANVDQLALSILRKGITESSVFPDLAGLSTEIRRSLGY